MLDKKKSFVKESRKKNEIKEVRKRMQASSNKLRIVFEITEINLCTLRYCF